MGQLNGVAQAVDRGHCKLNGQGGQGENQDPHGRSGLPLGPPPPAHRHRAPIIPIVPIVR